MQTHRFALQERRVWIFVKGSQSHSQRWYVLCSCFNRVGVWTRAPTGSGCLSSGCAREKAMLESAERSEGILHYVACQFRLSMRLRVSLSHSSLSLPHAHTHTLSLYVCLALPWLSPSSSTTHDVMQKRERKAAHPQELSRVISQEQSYQEKWTELRKSDSE